MERVHPFTVIAELPEALRPLRELAYNLWWSWTHPARNVFRRLSPDAYVRFQRNPVRILNSLSLEEIRSLAADRSIVSQIEEVKHAFASYQQSRSWWQKARKISSPASIAYFSAEFGLHECLPIYSGGLGVLAGDHLKACSDLGIPLYGVGLFYYEGYFSQYLNADGWQQELYPQIRLNSVPIRPALGPKGEEIMISVDIRGVTAAIKVWEVQIGTLRLFLLDTNLEENDPSVRAISSRLYGGDSNTRIVQEIVLGIGGLRALRAFGIEPDVCHMNEGHSAILILEQIRSLMRSHQLDFETALLGVKNSNLFTTHTMVAAGHDMFSHEQIERHFRSYINEVDIDIESLLRLGRVNPDDRHEAFSMSVLAVRGSQAVNAVSELHGTVSRKLWQNIWPRLPLDEIPISHVTNGVHTATWLSHDMAALFDRSLGSNWRDAAGNPETWKALANVPNEELWRIRSRARETLISFCRERLGEQLKRRGAGRAEIEDSKSLLDPKALTIGFARRFVPYKRATLIFRDLDRLIRLIGNDDKPVQLIFAGKAHPADHPGKELIAQVVHAARRPELKNKLVFIENYDMAVARRLIQGVDLWVNNPRRPLEASGTSGMKVAINGGLNMSILDGWWCEAFNGGNGWCIGQGEEYEDLHYQDQVESRSIYDLLEREVIPTFYKTSASGVPDEWLALVKQSMISIIPRFSATRMATDYAEKFYLPLAEKSASDRSQSYRNVSAIHNELVKFKRHWSDVRVLAVDANGPDHLELGKALPVVVNVQLGRLKPEEVAVEVRYGKIDAIHHLQRSQILRLNQVQALQDEGAFQFAGELQVDRAGSYGFSVRVVPLLSGSPQAQHPGLISWWI